MNVDFWFCDDYICKKPEGRMTSKTVKTVLFLSKFKRQYFAKSADLFCVYWITQFEGRSTQCSQLTFKAMFTRLRKLQCFNPLNPNIKIQILVCYPYTFSIEVVGRIVEVSVIIFILGDHVLNSHDHTVLQSIDITRRKLMLITLRALRVKAV